MKSIQTVYSLRHVWHSRFVATTSGEMELSDLVSALDKFAPSKLAESWDNVGLLVEPTQPHDKVQRMMLTSMWLPGVSSGFGKKEN